MNWYIFLTPLLLLPIIFLFRLVGCGLDTSGIPGDGDDGGDGGPDRPTTYAFTGPKTGETGVASKDFTVSLPSGQTVPASVTVTPSDGGDGGMFEPTSVVLTPGSSSATFTYTPASVGDKTISTTNDDALTDPAPLTYVSTAPLINITFVLSIVDSIPLIQPNPLYYIWPKFTIGDGEPIDYVVGHTPQDVTVEGTAYTPFTIEGGPVQVPAGTQCSCDVYITRLSDGNDANHPIWDPDHHLIGAVTVETPFGESDIFITFILSYNPATSPPTDYLASDFELTLQPPTGP
jgi:hypothetical protein